MSIRPIDYINTISKSQEVSKVRQVENDRARVQIEHLFQQQDKKIKQNTQKVRDTSKTENMRIDVDKRRQSEKDKERSQEENENKNDKKNDKNGEKLKLGGTIDIKI